jgi:hypothetical protein
MMPDVVPLLAVVIVLFPLVYFCMAAIPFLFVRLDVPEVSRLFRGLFNSYFWIVGFTGFVASGVFAASGRMGFTTAMLLLAVTLIAGRRAVLQWIDAQQSAWQSGDTAAMRRLRLIHWGGMLANILIFATVASSVQFIV